MITAMRNVKSAIAMWKAAIMKKYRKPSWSIVRISPLMRNWLWPAFNLRTKTTMQTKVTKSVDA